MNWSQLLSLSRQGDSQPRKRLDQDDSRLGFDVDFDRIIFSSAFRSLQDKTQVIPLSKDSFVHTRLTHSSEVAVVARSIGRQVGKEVLKKHPDLVDEGYDFRDFGAVVAAAALSHDIGNPPFGHSGERAIGEFFALGQGKKYKSLLSDSEYQDLVKFEGNANGFKILTSGLEGQSTGIRLSFATLGAFVKYPKFSLPHKPTSHIADKKYGFFQEQKNFAQNLCESLGLSERGESGFNRHPLAFLVEAADDICYTIIDFEDGINLGLIEEEYALEYMMRIVRDRINVKKYWSIDSKQERVAYLRAIAIGVLIDEAVNVFLKNESKILDGSFDRGLMDRCQYEAQIQDILQISREKIYNSKEVLEKELIGFKVLNDLLYLFCETVEGIHANLDSAYHRIIVSLIPELNRIAELDSCYKRLINTTSLLSSYSDGQALELHKKLRGLT